MSVLLVIGIILFVLWLLGLVTGRTLGRLVHMAFVVAVILMIIWLLQEIL